MIPQTNRLSVIIDWSALGRSLLFLAPVSVLGTLLNAWFLPPLGDIDGNLKQSFDPMRSDRWQLALPPVLLVFLLLFADFWRAWRRSGHFDSCQENQRVRATPDGLVANLASTSLLLYLIPVFAVVSSIIPIAVAESLQIIALSHDDSWIRPLILVGTTSFLAVPALHVYRLSKGRPGNHPSPKIIDAALTIFSVILYTWGASVLAVVALVLVDQLRQISI